ncbi:hypothetical protein [Novilysobacter erysipheiresistens]|uniref:Uncharacterized protein n=1 Tax=Novilysobacter erysipheiresistens TaxID=1749332 RepID=A0ABU7YYE0_9GAMM
MTRSDKRSLQLDEHLEFQRLLHVLRTIGMLVLLAGIVAALAGVFGGGGPMSQAHATGGALDASYPRFARFQSPALIAFELPTAAVGGDSFELVLEGDHVREFDVEHIVPEPREVAAAGHRVRYTFDVAPGERQLVRIKGRPQTIGRVSGTAAIGGQPPLRIDSFVYP